MSGASRTTTRRVSLRILPAAGARADAGEVFDRWERISITRSMEEISGGFELDYHDAARLRAAFPHAADPQPRSEALRPGLACRISIDGEPVLEGHIDDVKLSASGADVRMGIAGRDRTGDLVDSSANPDGPAEYRNITLTELARRLCAPFGITVRADVDVGAPLPLFSLDVGDRVLEALEKAARQRGVLLVSDGIGGLVITRGGSRPAPAPLSLPGNVLDATFTASWRERFSEYVVKGQTRGAAGTRALDGTGSALTPGTPPAPSLPANTAAPRERAGIVMSGRARDADVTRHRPHVAPAKTQSAGASLTTQAEWMRRVGRGKSERLVYKVLDWRAGAQARLWRPNELVAVSDPFTGSRGDMLIASVTYGYGPEGAVTTIELVRPEAFDLLPEEERVRARQRPRRLDGGANPLTAPTPARPANGS